MQATGTLTPDLVHNPPGAIEARLESWLLSSIDGKDPRRASDRTTSEVIEALGTVNWQRTNPIATGQTRTRGDARVERARLKVTRHASGIATLRLLVTSLLREQDLDEVAEALDCLVLSGTRRVLIDFGPVEKMSSQVVSHLISIHRQCSAAADGRVAVCGLRPSLLELFELTGLSKVIGVFPDERSALASAWPEPAGPRPLPIAVLRALRARNERAHEPMNDDTHESTPPTATLAPDAWLVVMSGPRAGRGRAVPITEAPMDIGRDADCAIRSSYPGLSRRHARIQIVNGEVLVTDLGSTNGTMVKDQLLKGDSAVLGDRARLTIGPLRFAVAIGRAGRGHEVRDETIVEWLRDHDDADGASDQETEATRLELPQFASEQAATFDTLRAMVIEGTVVVAPRKARLEGEALVEDLRRDLNALAEAGWPRRVVVNMVAVDQLSSQAVGVLLAHALHLERLGGGLRLCQVNPRALAVLERIKVPQIIDTFQSIDDAVLTSWE